MNPEAFKSRAALIRRVRICVLWTSAVWSVFMLAGGYVAAFGMTAADTSRSLFALALIFISPAAFSITALRLPRVAGIGLLLSVPIAIGCAVDNWADVIQVLSRGWAWPHAVFGLSFLFLGKYQQYADV